MDLRPLSDDPAELAALGALLAAAYGRPGWDDEARRIRAIAPDAWRVLADDDGLVACGCALAWGSFGWIGLVATRPDRERQGLGRAITDALAERLAAEGATVAALDASAKGEGLYRQLGYATMGHVRCLVAPSTPLPPPARAAAPLLDRDLAEVLALDAAAFGAVRTALIHRLRAEGAPGLVVRDADGALAGFALVTPNDGTIGPSAARSADAVHALVAGAQATGPVDGGRVLLPPESAWGDALEALGFTESRRLARMHRPGAPLPGERSLLVSEASYAVG